MMRAPAEQLAAVMHSVLASRGVSREHASFVVNGLLTASLRGIDTHGIRLFPVYLAELDGGRARAQPQVEWSPARGGTRRLDAGHALGLVAGMIASRESVALARENSIGAVSVFNSNHFGAASVFTIEMARAEVVGICCSNSDALVASFDGATPLFGSNPLSIAAGNDDELFCLDMATSQVSFSQLKARLAKGEPLPDRWAVQHDGSDAAGVHSLHKIAALKPLGGYKGQGLAMAISILCALLGDSPLDVDLGHFYTAPFDVGRQISHLFIALNIEAFVQPAEFRRRLAAYLAHVRSHGGSSQAPGDLEIITQRDRIEYGIPLTTEELAFFGTYGLNVQVRR